MSLREKIFDYCRARTPQKKRQKVWLKGVWLGLMRLFAKSEEDYLDLYSAANRSEQKKLAMWAGQKLVEKVESTAKCLGLCNKFMCTVAHELVRELWKKAKELAQDEESQRLLEEYRQKHGKK